LPSTVISRRGGRAYDPHAIQMSTAHAPSTEADAPAKRMMSIGVIDRLWAEAAATPLINIKSGRVRSERQKLRKRRVRATPTARELRDEPAIVISGWRSGVRNSISPHCRQAGHMKASHGVPAYGGLDRGIEGWPCARAALVFHNVGQAQAGSSVRHARATRRLLNVSLPWKPRPSFEYEEDLSIRCAHPNRSDFEWYLPLHPL
jgi:hypothetical protein